MEKITLRVPLPPPNFRTIWDYNNADVGSIQRAIENFNWQYAFFLKVKPLMKRYKFLVKYY